MKNTMKNSALALVLTLAVFSNAFGGNEKMNPFSGYAEAFAIKVSPVVEVHQKPQTKIQNWWTKFKNGASVAKNTVVAGVQAAPEYATAAASKVYSVSAPYAIKAKALATKLAAKHPTALKVTAAAVGLAGLGIAAKKAYNYFKKPANKQTATTLGAQSEGRLASAKKYVVDTASAGYGKVKNAVSAVGSLPSKAANGAKQAWNWKYNPMNYFYKFPTTSQAATTPAQTTKVAVVDTKAKETAAPVPVVNNKPVQQRVGAQQPVAARSVILNAEQSKAQIISQAAHVSPNGSVYLRTK